MIESYRSFHPTVPEDAWVHQSAVVSGDVELASGVSVWPTAVLRGDQGAIRVGARSNIQDGSVIHNTGGMSTTRVGERVTVGHRVILHGCVIEDDCLIGMGAIVMDNAVIGTGSIVGAGALVTANTVIPPGSLVLGSPGKVTRTLNAKQMDWIQHAWTVYYERCLEELGGN